MKWQSRGLILDPHWTSEAPAWLPPVLLPLDVFIKRNLFFWRAKRFGGYQVFLLFHLFPFLVTFLKRIHLISFMALFLLPVFLLNCSPAKMPHIVKHFGIDFHVVENECTWETTLCDSESAAGSQLVVCSHDLALSASFLEYF